MGQIERSPEQAIFRITCSCGSNKFRVLGFPMTSPGYPDLEIFAAPIYLKCDACGKTDRLFDPDHDGYNAEIDSSCGVTGDGGPEEYPCPVCGSRTFEPEASLEYALEDEDMDGHEELAARPQDFFTWFSLEGTCAKCGQVAEVTDYECA